MALQIDLQKGAKQSHEASRYFNRLADELVKSFIRPMTPRQYNITNGGHESVYLRIWSVDPWLDEGNKEEALGWLGSIMTDVANIGRAPANMDQVHTMMERWLTPRPGTENFFIEQLNEDFTSDDVPQLSIGVLGGHLSVLSAPSVMYMALEPDLYGLAVAGFGSYLVQELHGVPVPLRRTG
jgi:hypothetical protein